MTFKSASIDVGAPPDVVFDFLTDPTKIRAWAHEQVQLELPEPESDLPLSTGVVFRERVSTGGRLASYEGEVVACERPHALVTRLRGTDYSLDVELDIQGTATSSHVEMRSKVADAKPMARVMGALFGYLTQRMMVRRLWLLKRAVEDSRAVT